MWCRNVDSITVAHVEAKPLAGSSAAQVSSDEWSVSKWQHWSSVEVLNLACPPLQPAVEETVLISEVEVSLFAAAAAAAVSVLLLLFVFVSTRRVVLSAEHSSTLVCHLPCIWKAATCVLDEHQAQGTGGKRAGGGWRERVVYCLDTHAHTAQSMF